MKILVWEIATYYLVPAQEAATIAMMHPSTTAKLITESGILDKVISDHKAKAGRKGGLKKAERIQPLKDKVIYLHDEKYSSIDSARQAAKKIMDELSDDDLIANDNRPYLVEGNDQDRIYKWILEHRKDIK